MMGIFLGNAFSTFAQLDQTQDEKLQVQDKKLKVLRMFDETKDETTIFVSPGLLALTLRTLNTGLITQSVKGVEKSVSSANLKVKIILADAYYKFSGKTVVRPQNISFTFVSDEGQNKYKDNLNFSVSLGQEIILQGKMEYIQRVINTSNTPIYEEVLKMTIPVDVFLRVTKEKNIRFQLGSKNYKMKGTERESLQNFTEFIENIK